MFFILNRLLFGLEVPAPPTVAVRSVSARLTSLSIAAECETAKGAEGRGRSDVCGGVVGGVSGLVDVSNRDANVGLEVGGGGFAVA